MEILKNKFRNKSGITVVALVITIVIMLILVGIGINIITGPVSQAKRAKIITQLTTYKEELEMYKASKKIENEEFIEESLTAGKSSLNYNTKSTEESGNIKTILGDITGNYYETLEIIKGKLVLNTKDKEMIDIAQSLDIQANPYDIEDGVLLSSYGNLLLMDSNGTLTIPDTVTTIGEGAFANLTGLKTIIIPGTCKEIAKNAFINNTTLEKVILQDGVEIIGQSAFQECSNLKEIQMTNSITKIGQSAFFGDKSLTDINLSQNLKTLSGYVFYNCTNLTEVILPDGILSIEGAAFNNCKKLQSIYISKTVTSIASSSFINTSNLTTINIDPENNNFEFSNGILFNKDKTKMLILLDSAITSNTFYVPEGIQTLSNEISRFTNITTLYIPSSVESLSSSAINNTITSVIIDSENKNYTSDGKFIYSKDGKRVIRYYANESSVTLNEGIEYIENNAFKNKENLTIINLPNSLKSILSEAFSGCKNLTSLDLGENISNFTSMSIYNSGIENVTINENNPNYSVINGALYNKDGTVFISPLKKLGTITTYEIPSGVKTISTYAFHNQNKMTSIILPNTLEKIENSFNYCTSLTKIEIPSSVVSISSSCFANCGNNLSQIIVHKSAGSISGSPWGCIYGEKAVTWIED